MSQLALPLALQDHAVFDSFLPAGNEALVAFLRDEVARTDGTGAWLSGAQATGKTHLLQAVCERAAGNAQYLPLDELRETDAAILDGLASRPIVCLDDVDAVSGEEAWELGLFSLCNAMAEANGVLLCAASTTPRAAGFALPDLLSRFSQLPVFQIQPLVESQRIQALRLRARHRGLDLPDDAASYLIHRSARDMASLYALLDQLDAQSMIAKRRLTVPFVRDVLAARVSHE